MPRIPTRQLPDDWDDYEDELDEEQIRERLERKQPKGEDDPKQQRRNLWHKNNNKRR